MVTIPLQVILMIIITAAVVGNLVGTNIMLIDNRVVLDSVSEIVSEQDRQRKQVNISTVEFVNSFNNLVDETHETLVLLNRSVTNEGVLQTTVSRLQLDSAQSTENERTMFSYLDDQRKLITNITNNQERIIKLIENITKN